MFPWAFKLLVKQAVPNYVTFRCLTTTQALFLKNYYAILGLERNCDPKEIRPKYMEMCKLHHPDTITSGNEQEIQEKKNLFQDINEAYTQLSRKETRTEHDQELDVADEENQMRNNMYRYTGCSHQYDYSPGWRVFNEEADRFWNTSWEDDYLEEELKKRKQRQKERKRRREAERQKRQEAEFREVEERNQYYEEQKEYHKKMIRKLERQAFQASIQRKPDIVNLWNQTLNMYDGGVLRPNDHLYTYPDQGRREKKVKKDRRKTRYFTFED